MSYFPSISNIKYEGTSTKNMFAFRHYNPDEIVNGKTMKEHMRFAVAYWHTFLPTGKDPFGGPTSSHTWEHADELTQAKNRVAANFELMEKLGIEFFCFHDTDIAPEGASLEEFYSNLDVITDLMKEQMDKTGLKLLWNTANNFSNPKYTNGAATTNNADVFAHAAAQVKKGLDLAKKLGAENYVFWGGREGYENLINTDMGLELDNLATLFKMAIAYKKEIGIPNLQFLIEPKPKEPTKHQYDFDSATTIAFLRTYGLEDHFKLNLEANHATLAMHTFDHEIRVAAAAGMLGSLDANQGDLLLGWDTDEFPTDLTAVTLAMYEIVKAGGLGSGGVNFDAKVRRSSTDLNDLFLAHIAGMDTFASGLKTVEELINDNYFENIVAERYTTFHNTEIGKSVLDGTATFETLSAYAYAKDVEKITVPSDRLEYVKAALNEYIF